MALVYIVEDDGNIREMEAFALKNADMISGILHVQKIFTVKWNGRSRTLSCWILCCPMKMV